MHSAWARITSRTSPSATQPRDAGRRQTLEAFGDGAQVGQAGGAVVLADVGFQVRIVEEQRAFRVDRGRRRHDVQEPQGGAERRATASASGSACSPNVEPSSGVRMVWNMVHAPFERVEESTPSGLSKGRAGARRPSEPAPLIALFSPIRATETGRKEMLWITTIRQGIVGGSVRNTHTSGRDRPPTEARPLSPPADVHRMDRQVPLLSLGFRVSGPSLPSHCLPCSRPGTGIAIQRSDGSASRTAVKESRNGSGSDGRPPQRRQALQDSRRAP